MCQYYLDARVFSVSVLVVTSICNYFLFARKLDRRREGLDVCAFIFTFHTVFGW